MGACLVRTTKRRRMQGEHGETQVELPASLLELRTPLYERKSGVVGAAGVFGEVTRAAPGRGRLILRCTNPNYQDHISHSNRSCTATLQ